MNEQKLNEKLAEWRFGEGNLGYNNLGAVGEKVWAWVDWRGKGQPPVDVIDGRIAIPIDFPNNLNTCFKWLVPKLPSDTFHINFVLVPAGYACDILTPNKRIGYGLSKSPALALCLAIEKLIDGKIK